MESWMISAVIAIVGVIATMATSKQKIDSLMDMVDAQSKEIRKLKDHSDENDEKMYKIIDDRAKTIHTRIDASFKRVDASDANILVLDRDCLRTKEATSIYVPREVLDLKLELVDKDALTSGRDVDRLDKRVETLLCIEHKR